MDYTTIISTQDVFNNLHNPNWVIVDCRFSLDAVERGQRDYLRGHIPGAVYCHLEDDLCAPTRPGRTGRHPLPPVEKLVDTIGNFGIDSEVQVVAYDDWPGNPGGIAARLWWSLRYLGHMHVALMDGGWNRWVIESRPVHPGEVLRKKTSFQPRVRPELVAEAEDVERMSQDPAYKVFDARRPDRYRGEFEPIDPVAGHIPGAISAFYGDNYGENELFLPPEQLKERFLDLLGETPASQTAFYCGSGVTAAVNLVALARAGLGDGKLYVGAWSEWITNPAHQVSTASTA